MAQPKLPAAVTSALQAGGAPAPSDADRRAATAAYANASLAEQERLGVPESARQVLPESEAQDLVARILAGDPTQTDQTLRDLAADWRDAWPTVLDDLTRAGLPVEYTALATAKLPAAHQTIANVLAAQAKEPGTLRNKAGNDANPIDDLVARLHEDGILSSDRVKLAKLVAYYHAQSAGPDESVRRALTDIDGHSIILAMGHGGGGRSSQSNPTAIQSHRRNTSEPIEGTAIRAQTPSICMTSMANLS